MNLCKVWGRYKHFFFLLYKYNSRYKNSSITTRVLWLTKKKELRALGCYLFLLESVNVLTLIWNFINTNIHFHFYCCPENRTMFGNYKNMHYNLKWFSTYDSIQRENIFFLLSPVGKTAIYIWFNQENVCHILLLKTACHFSKANLTTGKNTGLKVILYAIILLENCGIFMKWNKTHLLHPLFDTKQNMTNIYLIFNQTEIQYISKLIKLLK